MFCLHRSAGPIWYPKVLSSFSPLGSEPMETLEDIYIGSIETDRGTREQVRFYDTRGLRDGLEFPRHYFSFADGFVLVYSIDSKESFKRMEALKKDIDRYRDKKEVRTFIDFNGSCKAQCV